jgi:hypothetical protein
VPVRAVKITVRKPVGTETLEGTVRTELSLDRVIAGDDPETGIASVTMQLIDDCANRAVLAHTNEDMAGGTVSEIVAVALDPFSEAVMVAPSSSETLPVRIWNVAVVAFAGTVTEAGAVNTGAAQLVNVTTAPPAGAWFEMVTVQTALALEANAPGVHCKDVMVRGACKEMLVDALVPLREPVSVAVELPAHMFTVPPEVFPPTLDVDAACAVETLNVAWVAFAATVTDAGAVSTLGALFVNVTDRPPTEAGCDTVTVQDVVEFGPMVVAAQDSMLNVGACNISVVLTVEPFNEAVKAAD